MSAAEGSAGQAIAPARSIAAFLEDAGVVYELIEHEPTMSASEEARAAHYAADQVAKTVILRKGDSYVLVALPASERLDLHKLRAVLGATRQLQLASEDEIARAFPGVEVGAVPPFATSVPDIEVIDPALLGQPRILWPAGDHRHSVLVDPHDVARICAARIAEITGD
ncbi:MAG: aminoacyl-tRNA deacylase [Solirubrobacteraceae bacterium]